MHSKYNDDGDRLALIELKIYDSDKYIREDFLELLMEKSIIKYNYFIHTIENSDNDTLNKKRKEYSEYLKWAKKQLEAKGKPEKSKLKVILWDIEKSEMIYNDYLEITC